MLSIIGTAGRKEDADKLNSALWNKVKMEVYSFVKNHNFPNLISGGAAFSDHLCVNLFNAGFVKNLTLCLPCKFENGKYLDNGEFNSFSNPGGTANYYHKKFSKTVNRDSLSEISTAIEKGANIIIGKGFYDRNKIVAEKSNILLAITFGGGGKVKDGGTKNTVESFIKLKGNNNTYHLDLNLVKIFNPIVL